MRDSSVLYIVKACQKVLELRTSNQLGILGNGQGDGSQF